MSRWLICFWLLVSGLSAASPAMAAESCRAVYRARSGDQDAIGVLEIKVNQPCVLMRHVRGKAGSAGMEVISAPKHALVQQQPLDSFLITPAKNYQGDDRMTVQMLYTDGTSGTVRFAIMIDLDNHADGFIRNPPP